MKLWQEIREALAAELGGWRGKTRTKRRAPNRQQLRCHACNLFVRRLCTKLPEPCGVCPPCCPGGHLSPAGDGR